MDGKRGEGDSIGVAYVQPQSAFVRDRAVACVRYLGSHSLGPSRVSLFLDKASVVAALRLNGSSVIQGFQKLVMAEKQTKSVNLDQIHAALSGARASVEIAASRPTRDDAQRIVRVTADSKWVERELKRIREALYKQKKAYERWKGVRDLGEAHDNLQSRHDEIFELGKDIVGAAQRPAIIREPHRYAVSAWQTMDRIRLNELRYQAGQRATSLKQRIDFTRKNRIKDLEQKKKDLEQMVKEEKKREKGQRDEVTRLVHDSLSLRVSIIIRGPLLYVEGRIGSAVAEASRETEREAGSLKRRLLEVLGLNFKDAEPDDLLLGGFVPDLPALRSCRHEKIRTLIGQIEGTLALVPKDTWVRSLQSFLQGLLERDRDDGTGDLSRFPVPRDGSRLAYLGLALSQTGEPLPVPLLFDLDEQGPRHTAVVGGSGSGKSQAAGLIVEGASLHGIPSLVFDPTRAWTGLALPCSSTPMLSRFDDFKMEREWAMGFELEILERMPEKQEEWERILGKRVTVLSFSHLTQDQESLLVARLLESMYQKIKDWPESKALRLLMVFEEAHRVLKDKKLQPILELFARTARAKGVGLLVVSQVAVDLPPAVRNNCATKIQMQTNYAQDLTRAGQVYGTAYRDIIPRLKQGQGALHYPEYGSCLVAFRPRLSSPTPLSETAALIFTWSKAVEKAAATLRQSATSDATRHDASMGGGQSAERPQTAVNGASAHDEPRDWRDVASEFAKGRDTKLSARDILDAVKEKGVEPPSLRTMQRFLASQ